MSLPRKHPKASMKERVSSERMLKVWWKGVYIFLLLSVFFYLFAWDSVQKFWDEETFYTERKIPYDESQPPAVSVMVHNLKGTGGWKPDKQQDGEYLRYFGKFCNLSEEYWKVVQCIENQTYSVEDTFLALNNGKKSEARQEIR